MFKTVEYKNLIGNLKDYVLIDVRSPKEYEDFTIPGAVNIPLFTNEEREKIGTVYVNESVEKAKRMGIEAVSSKLPLIFDDILKLHKDHRNLVFFCARGGMRSGSISALVNSLGMNAYKIKGGYKGYREFINSEMNDINSEIKYIVVHGKTGIGKTEMLKKLRSKGYDMLDLEACANHRGSLLGSIGLGECRSQKMFESLVIEELRKRKTNYVFVEGESKRIGNIILSNDIFDAMKRGYHIYIESSLEERADLLIEEYTSHGSSKEEILSALDNMEKYLGKKKTAHYKELINNNDFYEVTLELMTDYYDPMYLNSMKGYEFEFKFYVENVDEGVNALENWYKDNIETHI
ncbi:MAG: tRNA 2-selenouridine(34) synthase MnmH [Clostridium sp.]|uniref:tRNA 2-selenouridine(34) synthase MnmH n=1 Tax=Clostridium sp. TaxID=1506 RepID=UPI002A8F5C95|nr:tRNA 2-selenouridine(34) synthase MnmH [Clostridium sp.]MDY5097834.1 tRNA 2-selenouridine(34) synthase MnmH [Clostridium sp.]